MPTRIRYVDIAKGIAILCVIFGHTTLLVGGIAQQSAISDTLRHVCFTFHMPLFFIISGYFMHPERDFRWRKESRELIATYALTCAAIIIINTVLAFRLRTGTKATFKGWIAAAFYGAGDFDANYVWQVPFRVGALWFLFGLFWAHLIVHMAAKTGRFEPLVILASFAIGYGTARHIWLPWSIQSGMCVAAFVYVGVLMRRHDLFRRMRGQFWTWIIAALVWILAIHEYVGFSMAMNSYGGGWHSALSVVGALAGTYCVVGISMLIDRFADAPARALALGGRASLALLCVHLLEDDTMPWWMVLPALSQWVGPEASRYLWIIVFVGRVAVDGFVAWLLFRIPGVNRLFFPYLEKRAIARPRSDAAATASATPSHMRG